MVSWFSAAKLKLLLALGSLMTLFLVYFVGRRNRKGEVNLAVAQRELNQVQAQHAKIEDKLGVLHARQTDIIADILAEESARIVKQNADKELSDDEVIERLRTDHLLK